MPKNPNLLLATRLRVLRAKLGWSQEELAERCGLHRTYIGAIERGERNVTLSTVHRIARAIGISSAELIAENWHVRDSERSSGKN